MGGGGGGQRWWIVLSKLRDRGRVLFVFGGRGTCHHRPSDRCGQPPYPVASGRIPTRSSPSSLCRIRCICPRILRPKHPLTTLAHLASISHSRHVTPRHTYLAWMLLLVTDCAVAYHHRNTNRISCPCPMTASGSSSRTTPCDAWQCLLTSLPTSSVDIWTPKSC